MAMRQGYSWLVGCWEGGGPRARENTPLIVRHQTQRTASELRERVARKGGDGRLAK